MCELTDICAICKRRSDIDGFSFISCGQIFHTSCLATLMRSRRSSSLPCPTCRRPFLRKNLPQLYLNEPKCRDHCGVNEEEPPTAAVVVEIIDAAESNAASTDAAGEQTSAFNVTVEPSTGARSRDPVILFDDGTVMAPVDEISSTTTSMPSLELMDPDYSGAAVSEFHHKPREVSSEDISRSVCHLFLQGVVDESTSSITVHAMAESDAVVPPAIPEDVSAERRLALITVERGALQFELAALQGNLREMRRLWAVVKRHFDKCVADMDACVRELFSAYVQDVNEAANFTRQHRFSYNNMNLRHGHAAEQRDVFDRSLRIARGYMDGRHGSTMQFDVFSSHADGAVNNVFPVPCHLYHQRVPATWGRGASSNGVNPPSTGANPPTSRSSNPSSTRAVNSTAGRAVRRIQGDRGGYVFWPRESYRECDYPIVRVTRSGRPRGRQSRQADCGGRQQAERQRHHSPVPLLFNGNAN